MFLFCKNKKFWTNFSPFITSKVVQTKQKIEIQIFDIFVCGLEFILQMNYDEEALKHLVQRFMKDTTFYKGTTEMSTYCLLFLFRMY
jgi:hypothetical protein